MTPTIQPDPVPLRVDEHGVIRVGETRLYLELIVDEYDKGATPEQIVDAYDSLELADVYAAIAYYLRHRDEVREYMRQQEQKAQEVEDRLRAERPVPPGLKEKLLACRVALERSHASSGQ